MTHQNADGSKKSPAFPADGILFRAIGTYDADTITYR